MCDCCDTNYTYSDNVITYDDGTAEIPPKEPLKDPVKNRMKKQILLLFLLIFIGFVLYIFYLKKDSRIVSRCEFSIYRFEKILYTIS